MVKVDFKRKKTVSYGSAVDPSKLTEEPKEEKETKHLRFSEPADVFLDYNSTARFIGSWVKTQKIYNTLVTCGKVLAVFLSLAS